MARIVQRQKEGGLMAKRLELIGERFGKLTVIDQANDYISNNGHHISRWKCLCDCGNEVVVRGPSLTRGHTKSCGCNKGVRKFADQNCERLVRIWDNIRNRCYNDKNPGYKNYGGRGIDMCDAWKSSYKAFEDWAVKNGYNDNLTIDRIDNSAGYTPENCRWATHKEQANNTRNNHFITIGDETHTVAEWEDINGFTRGVIEARLQYGWDEYRAVMTKITRPAKITIDNVTHTLTEWAIISGVDRSVISARLQKGVNERDAVFQKDLRKATAKKVTINGIERVISEWSKISGVPATTIGNRISNGWDEYDAVFRPVRRNGGKNGK